MNDRNEIVIDFATLRDGYLNISGYLNRNKSIIAVCNGEKFLPDSYNFPTRSNSLVHNFDFLIPVFDSKLKIEFIVDGKKDVPVEFRDICNLSEYSRYYVKDNKIVYYNGDFNVEDYSYGKMLVHEMGDLFRIIFSHESFIIKAVLYRLIFILLYPLMRNRKIWIILDRRTMADDNAEHFFKYAITQNDDVEKFFAIQEGTSDYNRLSRQFGNVLKYGSFKHRFYYSFAEKVISSQGSEFYLNPFRTGNPKLTASISQVDFYFIQHGIIKDNMSTWLRKYDRNPKLIVTSTDLEYNSLFDEGYYYDRDVVQVLGLPRYDNLDNYYLNKRQIIIMPSWRNYLTNKQAFINSEFFKRFNSLINNQRLIDFAADNNYEIIFKPHPELNRYLDLFDKNYFVKFGYDKKYQDLFNDSDLLITDYSSVFFDFAYLKKPVIYYQYGIDYHYNTENAYFNYKTMGFGDVFEEEDEIVDKVIEYINRNCEMEEIFKRRVDKFFKFRDKNNSKRCYSWIYRH